ncbi:MAG: CRISPR-associated protein Cmr4 family [Paenibacillaceae bacterium]|jgi:CRISPR-associated protein Cmr4|nr:CRISPR-associated protein Cmr4 family [Paenibacillaceae bacterium]
MKAHFYLIHTLTNMHAGTGEATDGVVDLPVQRDCITNYPQIQSSSLKGALRGYFSQASAGDVQPLFGDSNSYGSLRFLPAQLLALPLRSLDKPYYLATTSSILEQAEQLYNSLLLNSKGTLFFELLKELLGKAGTPRKLDRGSKASQYVNLEGQFFDKSILHTDTMIGDTLAVLSDDCIEVRTLFSEMPVIARNSLNNGISQNLWYEEFVPREAIFLTGVLSENDSDLTTFEKHVASIDGAIKIIQIGGNASIGYGLTIFKKIGEE